MGGRKKGNSGFIISLIVIGLVVLAGIFVLNSSNVAVSSSKYYEIINYYQKDEVYASKLELSSGVLEYVLKSDISKTYSYRVPNVGLFLKAVDPIIRSKNETGVIDYVRGQDYSWIFSTIPSILGLLIMIGIFLFMIKFPGGGAGRLGQFGKNNFKHGQNDSKKTTFAQVAGADEEKEELAEIVEFLKSPKKFNDMGARIPKGVLLVGPPGTGKTLLARAVAGEASVPFFSISGSDFVEMYVGVGASRVRDLFSQAKKESPAIIFIDEIDAVGRHRGAGLGGGHDEREQTLNQLLVEMDGFGVNEGIIVIAATNRRDILDNALLRPGRFDRQVVVGYPDIKGREEILKVHSKNKQLGFDVDLSVVAKSTIGFTGADLENLLNESALLAVKKGHKVITATDIQESTVKVVVGPEKRSKIVYEDEKKLTAYHEGGHAIAAYCCSTQDDVHQISIIPCGMAGGYTLTAPDRDRAYVLKTKMEESLVVDLGGRVAEAIVLGDISTGASSDIKHATETARSMVMKYGFTEKMGPIVYGGDNLGISSRSGFYGEVSNYYSEATSAEIDKEVKNIIFKAYDSCYKILNDNLNYLHIVAKYLIKWEKIDEKEFKDIMTGKITMADVEKLEQESSLPDEGESKDSSSKNS